jgi:pyruvate/2-oxoglutarate dehydrogenase complex dihydrolipoamide acyltransferase (E2) component
MVAEKQANEALEKLNQGIRKSRQMVQIQTMELAQEYFGDSIEALKQQVKASRATLRDLPKQIPGGEEEPFQMLFQELMDNYTTIEESLGEVEERVANLDTEQLRKQGELNATEAAKREARERGVDLTEVKGTGSGGRITIDDVRNATEEAEHQATGKEEDEEEPEISDVATRNAEEEVDDLAGEASGKEEVDEPDATNAAKRKAEELGIDLREVEGTGSGGLITIQDVLEKA